MKYGYDIKNKYLISVLIKFSCKVNKDKRLN